MSILARWANNIRANC